MNFLAHIYLSGNDEMVKVGNFIADWIKGADYKKFPAGIQKGIMMHRSIDTYTDKHPIIRKSKSRFTVEYHKYSGIIIDICYDHFLAKDWDSFCPIPLEEFNNKAKESLNKYINHFPVDLQEFIPKFMNFGWMDLYVSIDGIEKVLRGMVKNTSLPDKTDDAIRIINEYYNDFQTEFYNYFPQLVKYIEGNYHFTIDKPPKK
jgi:acyl carrier protein phosphodiesterase